jgi:hypothetical protein
VACDCEWLAESKSVEIHERVLCCHFEAAHAQFVRKLLLNDAEDHNDGDEGDERDDMMMMMMMMKRKKKSKENMKINKKNKKY